MSGIGSDAGTLEDSSPADKSAVLPTATRPLVFISHREADAQIASAVATWIMTASGNNVEIFQSSNGLTGIESGRSITEAIRTKVAQCAVMIVVYTDQDADWAWVMFEMGIAMDPTTPTTTVVVFQCGDDFPKVLTDFKKIRVAEESDRLTFARDFLTSNYFATHPTVVLAGSSEEFIKKQAQSFWAEIGDKIPPAPPQRDWYPHPSVRVQIPLRVVGALLPMDATRVDGLKGIVRDHAKVKWEEDIGSVFGIRSMLDLSLAELATKLEVVGQHVWIESCVDHVARCLAGFRPSEPMARVVATSKAEFQPLLIRMQQKRFDDIARFEIVFVPVTIVVPDA